MDTFGRDLLLKTFGPPPEG